MELITLHEWGTSQLVKLGPGEARELQRLEKVLDVRWAAPDVATIKAREGFIGSALLSPDLVIEVRPKVPVSSLLDLLATAYRGQPLPPAVGETVLAGGNANDWVAFLLVLEAERLLGKGVRRGYVDLREELPYIRGRIDFASSVGKWGRPGRLVCEFADFLMDTSENRIVVGTLSLLQSSRLHVDLQDRVDDLLKRLEEVIRIRPRPRDIEGLRLTRLNQHYRPTLDLCALILNGFGLTSETGEFSAGSFFLPMEVIFEKAVANWLQANLPGKVVAQSSNSGAIRHQTGSPDPKVTIRPDLVWNLPDGSRVVMDTKYAKPLTQTQFGGWTFKNSHIYQMVTYSVAYGCPGILLYPRSDKDVETTYELEGYQLRIQTVDLAKPGLQGLRGLSDALKPLAGLQAA